MPAAKRIKILIAAGLTLALAACAGSESSSSALSIDGERTSTSTNSRPLGRDGDLDIVTALPAPPETNNGQDELVAENDLLEVDVFQVDDLDRTVRVDPKGNISLALIGSLPAKGRTLPQLEADIEARYGAKYLQNPEVSVFMKESAGQRITIDGAVIKPGLYPVSSTSSLLQALALAGGLKEIADESKLYVFRQIGKRKLAANFDVKQIRAGKQPDPRIFGGDVIVSFESGAKVAAKNLREALGIASSAVILAPL
jgi:polysaccharide export outer membrane protein